MVTGTIKNKVDKIWTDIWAGGITNPLTVIEQLTYLMFIRSLDEKELETEEFENMTGERMNRIFRPLQWVNLCGGAGLKIMMRVIFMVSSHREYFPLLKI